MHVLRFATLTCLALALAGSAAPAQEPDENIKPSWLTEKFARTYTLKIPAPRGQILDRNGEPLAVTRVCQNLGISFPTPLDYPDAKAVAFAHEQIAKVERLTGRKLNISDKSIERFYRNRGILPFDIVQDVPAAMQKTLKEHLGSGLVLHPVYARAYPNGTLAAHIIGYATRTGGPQDLPIENNDLIWPDAEGRDGLEATFNEQLTGKPGQLSIRFDANGKKVYEKVTVPPTPGCNVITTLDLRIQKLCEASLAKGAKRGAIVFLDPNNGDILGMASVPTFNPNDFSPAISPERYNQLNNDPVKPMLSRAFRSAYPPGSTWKTISGIAALESGSIKPDDEFPGPPAISIGNIVMHNWSKYDAGMLTIAGAIERSCNTWFYQVGIKTGVKPLVETAQRFGFGQKTGIPLRAETEGNVTTPEFLKKRENRRFSDGDLANFSIGQGYLLVTPLQMAQAMGTVANGGLLHQTRLVLQVQSLDEQIVTGYDVRVKDDLELKKETLSAIKEGLIAATNGGHGTGHRASVDNVDVAGKTGTAEWGAKNRFASWYAGFAPADNPKYAFAAVYETNFDERAHGGTVAAPLVGYVLRDLFQDEQKPQKRKRPAKVQEEEENAD